jgi:RNA polymerase sigma-70 factor (ECF subfamily)
MDRRASSPPSGPAETGATEETLRRLLAEHGIWLRRLVERRCPRHLGIDPADIEQEVLVRVWRTLERESELRAPASFLHRVVATALVDAVRRRRARPEETAMLEDHERSSERLARDPEAAAPSPEALARRAEILAAVDRELMAMPDHRRLAIRLHLQGFDTTEIGRLAGWSEPKARNLVYRGLDQLRRRLRERGIEYASE